MTATPEPAAPTPHTPPRVATVKIGSLVLTGNAAIVALLALSLGAVALVAWSHPSPRMLAAAALWITFIVAWSRAARGAAPAVRAESASSRRRHELMMYGSLVLLFAPLPGLRTRLFPLTPALVATGFVVQSLAMSLAFWARRHLGRNWSGEVRIASQHCLVRSGPYRVLRHPIYSAMLGMFLGTTIVSGELHALIGFVIIGVAYTRKVPIEERALSDAFGAEWDDYRRASWALVPGIY